MSYALTEAQVQAMSMDHLKKHIAETEQALALAKAELWTRHDAAHVEPGEIMGLPNKALIELPAKLRGSSTEILVELRMMFQMERMTASGNEHKHAMATIRVAAVEQELTTRCAECVQYINDRAYLFANGNSYWGANALSQFEDMSQ